MKKKFLPATTKRVAEHTCDQVNKKIRDETISHINMFQNSTPAVLSFVLEKLNDEWDTGRVLEVNAASAVLLGSFIGLKKTKCLLFCLTGGVGFFLLQHALQGWCPPLSVIRKMGIRTAEEINNERIVLKHIRGDFNQSTTDTNELLAMAEK